MHIQYSEFRAPSVFQGKRKLLKNPEREKYIQHTKIFQDNSVFQGKRELLKNPEWKNIFQYSEKFRATLFFRASTNC